MNITTITDKELFKLCEEYGNKARFWRQKFAGLLPEVYRRKLYFQKGFGSIFEFAAKLAAMSEKHVRLVLNLEKKFEDKHLLKELLVRGEVSVSKLAKVASIATPENQEFLAAQLKILPRSAVETLARDEKYSKEKIEAKDSSLPGNSNLQRNGVNASAQNLLESDVSRPGIWSVSPMAGQALHISPEVEAKLLALQQKGIDINAMILEFLSVREIEIAQEKEKIAAEIKPTDSRYISAKIRAIIKKEHGEKCSIETCKKPSATIHHTQRFSLSQNHDPRFLAPLCHDHHTIAHSIDLKYHQARSAPRLQC